MSDQAWGKWGDVDTVPGGGCGGLVEEWKESGDTGVARRSLILQLHFFNFAVQLVTTVKGREAGEVLGTSSGRK